MITVLPVPDEERDKLYQELLRRPAKTQSAGMKLRDGAAEKGICLFTVEGSLCRIDGFFMQEEDAVLADGLLRAVCSRAQNCGAEYAQSVRQEDLAQLLSLGFIKKGNGAFLEIKSLFKRCCH